MGEFTMGVKKCGFFVKNPLFARQNCYLKDTIKHLRMPLKFPKRKILYIDEVIFGTLGPFWSRFAKKGRPYIYLEGERFGPREYHCS